MVKRGVIYVVTMEDMDQGLKRPTTIILKITEKVFMVMGEVDIALRTATLHPLV